jgi:hypothetical protein
MGAELNFAVWQNIDRILASKGILRTDFKRIVGRNKNTYTNWFNEPRPILKITDLHDIANALEVTPTELLKPALSVHRPTNQLELPFEPNSTIVNVQVQCVTGGIILRPPEHPSAAIAVEPEVPPT